MRAGDVSDTVDLALAASGYEQPTGGRGRLLSDNGASYLAGDLAGWLEGARASPIFVVRPNHPQTQGKIERWHQTLKNRVLLETTSCPVSSRSQSPPL